MVQLNECLIVYVIPVFDDVTYLLQLRCLQVMHFGWLQRFVLALCVWSEGSFPDVVWLLVRWTKDSVDVHQLVI